MGFFRFRNLAVVLIVAWSSGATRAEQLVVCNQKTPQTNVRSGPTTKDTTIVDKLSNNTELSILERVKNPEGTHDWLKVSFKNSRTGVQTSGFVYSEAAAAKCEVAETANTSASTPPSPEPVPTVFQTKRPSSSNPIETWEVFTKSISADESHTKLANPTFSPDNSSVLAVFSRYPNGGGSYRYTILEQDRYTAQMGTGGIRYWAKFLPKAPALILGVTEFMETKPDEIILRAPGGAAGTVKLLQTKYEQFSHNKSFDPAGRYFAATTMQFTPSFKGILHTLDLTTGKFVSADDCAGASAPYRAFDKMAFSPDGTRIAATIPEKSKLICVYETATGVLVARLEDPDGDPRSVAFLGDSDTLISAVFYGPSKIWSISSKRIVEKLPITRAVRVLLSPNFDRAVFVTIPKNDEVYRHELWNFTIKQPIATLSNSANVNEIFAADGSVLAVAASDKRGIEIVDPTDGSVRAFIAAQNVEDFGLAQNGKMVAWIGAEREDLHVVALGADEIARVKGDLKARQERLDGLRAAFKAARAEFDCDRVAELAKQLEITPEDDCPFEKLRQRGTAQEMFLEAAKLEVAKTRDRAKKLYETIISRFANDPLAIQAAMRLTSMADGERSEEAQKRAEEAQRSAEQAAARAAQQQVDTQRQSQACAHVYVGKRFQRQVKTIFGTGLAIYDVVGVSTSGGEATVRDYDSGARISMSCSSIP